MKLLKKVGAFFGTTVLSIAFSLSAALAESAPLSNKAIALSQQQDISTTAADLEVTNTEDSLSQQQDISTTAADLEATNTEDSLSQQQDISTTAADLEATNTEDSLLAVTTSPSQTSQSAENETIVGQSDVNFGRSTRSGPSYVGVGANIGIGDGDTALGDTSFTIFSKIGVTRNISARPAVLFSDDATILLPVTFDFVPGVTEITENVSGDLGLRISPYIGAGAAISTGDDSGVDFLATGGVDVPLSRNISATAAINATLFDNPAVGLLLGVGYNF